MATEKTLKTRVVLKHDTEANWNKATTFIPKKGEVIIYDPDNAHTYSRQKIGDGVKTVVALPFFENIGPTGPQGPKGNTGPTGTSFSILRTEIRSGTLQYFLELQNKDDYWTNVTSFSGQAGDVGLLQCQITDRENTYGYMLFEVSSYDSAAQTIYGHNHTFMYGPAGPTESQRLNASFSTYSISESSWSTTDNVNYGSYKYSVSGISDSSNAIVNVYDSSNCLVYANVKHYSDTVTVYSNVKISGKVCIIKG